MDEAKVLIEEVFGSEEWDDLKLFKVEEEINVKQLFDKATRFPIGAVITIDM